MTAFPRISTTKVGSNKDAPRVWLEGRYLLDAGFAPSTRVEIEFSENKAVIRLAENGPRVVSSKQRQQKQIPVLDINSSALAKAFGNINTLQVCITEGEITLSPSQTESLKRSRCRNGREGSVFAGGGLLTQAAKQAGYVSSFAIEVDPNYAEIFESNHPDALMFNASIEDVPLDALPPVELLTLGIPCEPYSTARQLDRKTGAKRDRSLPPEAHPLADLSLWSCLVIHKLNPATIVIEEAPAYLTSGAGFLMQSFLKRCGYTVEARVIDPRQYGEITGRIRSVIVAHSGSNFRWPEPVTTTRTFGEIRDDESALEDKYFTPETKSWLTNHWSNQAAKGNGFTSAQLDDQSTSVPCISKRYMAGQGTGAVVKHRERNQTWRWLTLNEIRKLHSVPESYYLGEDQSVTRAGEVIGQGVIVSFFEKIIAATRQLGTAIANPIDDVTQVPLNNAYIQQHTEAPDADQLGLAFA